MNWSNFQTYGESPQRAFEILSVQLFEKHLRRFQSTDLIKFRVVNGAAGDGGVEAYGQLASGDVMAVQAKWFRNSLDDGQFNQIRKSIKSALDLRPNIKRYIICVPRDVHSLKYVRGKKGASKKPSNNHEDKKVDDFTAAIEQEYTDLKLEWWFEERFTIELQQLENEGIQKFWFEKEVITISHLQSLFNTHKAGWLASRYVPELHGEGKIQEEYGNIAFTTACRKTLAGIANNTLTRIRGCLLDIVNLTNTDKSLEPVFEDASTNLKAYRKEYGQIIRALKTGDESFIPKDISEVNLFALKQHLEDLQPTNTQKNILPRLIKSLDDAHGLNLQVTTKWFGECSQQYARLILGEPGTGKTHGLAHAVENHLASKQPALIIQAKGCPNKNWTEILSHGLELRGWMKTEMLYALDALALKHDVRKVASRAAGEDLDEESTKILVCIDGLEEDIDQAQEWYSRIRESIVVSEAYPRMRFLFSARPYFLDSDETKSSANFDYIELPREGDVFIEEVAPGYFTKENYNIQIEHTSLIKGLDSLLALRLFCEEYRDRKLTSKDHIETAAVQLLNSKIERLDKEFAATPDLHIGKARDPVRDSLLVIAQYFYSQPSIEHNELLGMLTPLPISYLSNGKIDLLIDQMVNNGILIRSQKEDLSGPIKKRTVEYYITYQSIIEHVLSAQITEEIEQGTLTAIPPYLHQPMARPLDDKGLDLENLSPNWRIIQGIVNTFFIDHQKLIGENNFLTEGFDEESIRQLQLEALVIAPFDIAARYKGKVDKMFLSGGKEMLFLMKHLIIPSAQRAGSYFGATYLHGMLIKQPNVFERDKLWSGLDRFELPLRFPNDSLAKGDYEYVHEYFNVKRVIQEASIGFHLSEFDQHDQMPTVYAWCLSNIDREFREKLRYALAEWALSQPKEFERLLNKMISVDDPQILEDLASVCLGVAGKLKKKRALKSLAKWAVKHVFHQRIKYRNILVRHGFRAIVERAYQFDLISENEAKTARPNLLPDIDLLPLNGGALASPREEIYPIVHDLAWYVIDNAYDDFLELPTKVADKLKDRNSKEGKDLLAKHAAKNDFPSLHSHGWTMAAALSYIGALGFNRKKGNGTTSKTHGGKSQVYTYEEKYTWLAVHYIQGYLSDHVPLKGHKHKIIEDYSMVADIPNPLNESPNYEDFELSSEFRSQWIIKETLTPEIKAEQDTAKAISNAVETEPTLNLNLWLEFSPDDLTIKKPKKSWLALMNHTALLDSQQLLYSYISARACLIKEEEFNHFKTALCDSKRHLSREDISDFETRPLTHVYANANDLVWMNWVEEESPSMTYYTDTGEKNLHLTVTQVTSMSVEGESYTHIPSKSVREMLEIVEMDRDKFLDNKGDVVALSKKLNTGYGDDSQELLLVDKDAFLSRVKNHGFELIWIVHHFIKKNPLNKSIEYITNTQKVRRYLVRMDNQGHYLGAQYWNEYFGK